MPRAARWLLLIPALYGLLCVAVFFLQERLVFFPGPDPDVDPSDWGLSHEELWLEAADGTRLHSWVLRREDPLGIVLFCHGNAGNIGHRLPLAKAFVEMGLEVLLFDYRGYGRSEGEPSEEGTYLDARAAHEACVGVLGYPPAGIVLFGESLGGAVAIELACEQPVAGVAVQSTFLSIEEMGAVSFPWLPVRTLSRIHYDNRSRVAGLDVPLLIAHGPRDEIVPYEHGQELFALAQGEKRWLETVGGHNDGGFVRSEAGIEAMRGFLVAALRAAGPEGGGPSEAGPGR